MYFFKWFLIAQRSEWIVFKKLTKKGTYEVNGTNIEDI